MQMTRSFLRAAALDLYIIKHSSSLLYLTLPCNTRVLKPNSMREFAFSYNFPLVPLSAVFCKWSFSLQPRNFCCTTKPESPCWEESSRDALLKKLDNSLQVHEMDETWNVYTQFTNLYGIPDDSFMSRLITDLSYSSEPKWLQRACNIILLLPKRKSNLLQMGLLTKLSLSLARAQMPIPASTILRLTLLQGRSPPIDLLGTVILYMVKKRTGTYLASNMLFEIYGHFQHLRSKKSMSSNAITADTMIFNLVLDACVRYKSSFKGQQIIELMSQVGVIGDAQTIIIIARIHEMNGQRDDLQKYKDCVDQVGVPLLHHFSQFYDSLLSLHFKFDDIDAASELISDINRFKESCPRLAERKGPQKPFLIPIGSPNLRTGLKLQISPHLLQKDSVLNLERNEGYLMFKHGKLVLRNKALARLIIQYKRHGRISELSKLLISIKMKKEQLEVESSFSDVIDACIRLGWLDIAHDILDDMELEGIFLSSSYKALSTAYYERKMHREAEALLKQISNTGRLIYEENSTSHSAVSDKKSNLATSLFQEMKKVEKAMPYSVYALNSSIYFFMKAKMTDDALKTYRRMLEMNIHPTLPTFIYLVMGCASLELYRQITIIWGDIKRNSDHKNLLVSRDLYELLLLSFLKGGYFERVMEIVGCMKKHGMYADKWLYKSEFLKLHKDLYRNLKSCDARNDAQRKRLEHVQDFRKWVGID